MLKFSPGTLAYYAMLLAPFLLALGLLMTIQSVESPLRNTPSFEAADRGNVTPRQHRVNDRVSIMVILEIFAFTLIVRPWEFPWKPSRFVIAEIVFLFWSVLVVPISMHMGQLMGAHALAMMVLVGGVLPFVIVLLFVRDQWSKSRMG